MYRIYESFINKTISNEEILEKKNWMNWRIYKQMELEIIESHKFCVNVYSKIKSTVLNTNFVSNFDTKIRVEIILNELENF